MPADVVWVHGRRYYESSVGLCKGLVLLVLLPLVYRRLTGPPDDYFFAFLGMVFNMGKPTHPSTAEERARLIGVCCARVLFCPVLPPVPRGSVCSRPIDRAVTGERASRLWAGQWRVLMRF
jgi:hypothetical protein